MDPQFTKLFAFLIGNMKDMEIELRAQSMVFDALVQKAITVDDLGDALHLARNSTAMLGMVREKYDLLTIGIRKEGDANSVALRSLYAVN